MLQGRYVFKMASEQLGWVNIKAGAVDVIKPSWGALDVEEFTISEVSDLGGEAKLQSDSEMIDFLIRIISDPKVSHESSFSKVIFSPGEYMPRVWRGFVGEDFMQDCDDLNPLAIYGRSFTTSIVAAESLLGEVSELFRTIEPDAVNDTCYGHKFRELLILLCTEVEACWAGVFKLNFPSKVTDRLSTNEYFLLRDLLHLSDYSLSLKDYPGRVFSPFLNWSDTAPTKSIGWYAAYNRVKHDRELNFTHATLGAVLEAAAALHVMQVAQWGVYVFSILRQNRKSIFKVDKLPDFNLGEIYVGSGASHKEFCKQVAYENVAQRV